MFSDEKIEEYLDKGMDWVVEFVPNLILAIFVLIIGFWIVKRLMRLVVKSLEKSNISLEVTSFLESIINIVLRFVVILLAASIIGFEVSSLITLIAAVGFAVGMALQGFLGNFASGLTILFFRPYKVGDWVEISEKFGKVTGIQIFNTILVTPGSKTLIIPNGQVTDNIITNFSTEGYIRLQLQVTMPYAEDFPKVRETILNALKDVPYIVQDRDPEVGIESYDSHSIIIAVRPFINPDDYWEATFDVYARIKAAFSNRDIKVAYSEGVELGPIGS